MSDVLRLCCVALYAVGPVLALLALARRRSRPATSVDRVPGWRGRVPAFLLPLEWALPPALIFFGVGEVGDVWAPLQLAGFALALAGAAFLVWASAWLGRLLVHDAAVLEGHALVTGGPYRLVRHPVYVGFLAMLLGSGVAAAHTWVLLIWPASLLGILVQARSEERVLGAAFGQGYSRYAAKTGMLFPRLWGRALSPPDR
jgi:protein-S-isoprenylcysteine O-methyltransferase Ste14